MNNIKLASLFSLLSLFISAPIECANNSFTQSSTFKDQIPLDKQPPLKKRKLNKTPYAAFALKQTPLLQHRANSRLSFEEPKICISSESSLSTTAPFIQYEDDSAAKDKSTQQTTTTNTPTTKTQTKLSPVLLKKACNLQKLLVKPDSEQQIVSLLQQYKKTSTIIKIVTHKQDSSSASALELAIKQNSLPYIKALFKNAVFLLSKQDALSIRNKKYKTLNINSLRSALTTLQPTAQEPVASYLSKIINAVNNEQTETLSLLSEELGNSKPPKPLMFLNPRYPTWQRRHTNCKIAILKELVSKGDLSNFELCLENFKMAPNLAMLLINKRGQPRTSILETVVPKDLSYVKSALKQVFVLFANRKKEVDKEETSDLKETLTKVLSSAKKNTAPFIKKAITALTKTSKKKLKDFLKKEFNQDSTQK